MNNPYLQKWPHGYVLKVMNSHDSKNTDLVEAQNLLILYVGKFVIHHALYMIIFFLVTDLFVLNNSLHISKHHTLDMLHSINAKTI